MLDRLILAALAAQLAFAGSPAYDSAGHRTAANYGKGTVIGATTPSRVFLTVRQ